MGGFSRHRFPGHSVKSLNEMTDTRLSDFSRKQDALSLAVGGRDGLQLQEVQQHLDLFPREGRGEHVRGLLVGNLSRLT